MARAHRISPLRRQELERPMVATPFAYPGPSCNLQLSRRLLVLTISNSRLIVCFNLPMIPGRHHRLHAELSSSKLRLAVNWHAVETEVSEDDGK